MRYNIFNMKNKQKGSTAVVLLVIIVIVLLVMVGYMYFKQPVPVSQVSGNSQNIDTQNTTQTPSVPNQTAGWKTYASTQYGFSFQYPSAVSVSLVTHAPTHGTDLILPSNNSIEKDGSVGSILNFSIFQKSTTNLEQYVSNEVSQAQQTNNKFIDANGNPPVKISKTSMTISGTSAWLVRYEYPQSNTQKPVNRVYAQNSEHTFIFNYSDDNAVGAKQMLSTIKFTN